MGSATREALAGASKAISDLAGSVELATGEQLLQASRVISDAAQLRAALTDNGADPADKDGIVDAVFSRFTPQAQTIIKAAVHESWSTEDDLVAGLEELGIRAIAESAPDGVSIENELFSFQRAVRSNAELELAVGSKLGSAGSKAALIEDLLRGKASDQTVAILRQLVQQPRDRRIGELLRFATGVVADQSGFSIATVTAAGPIAPEQLERLAQSLSRQYGRGLKINQVIDPALIGGIRVQVGDEVIDGSIATKLNDLRLQLAR